MKELTTQLLDTVIYDSNLLISQMRSICIETVRLPQILGNGGFFFFFLRTVLGISLVVQWLRLCASNGDAVGSIPCWGTKISHTTRCGQKKDSALST